MDFYFRAAQAIDRLDARQGSVKAVCSASASPASSPKDRRRLLALVIRALKFRSALDTVLDKAGVLKLEGKVVASVAATAGARDRENGKGWAPPSPHALALVLTHDLVLTKHGIQAGDGPLKRAFERHVGRLKAELTRLQVKLGKRRVEDLGAEGNARARCIPRWVRVNQLRAAREDLVLRLQDKGWRLVAGPQLGSEKEFALSPHLPGLLAFHPSTTSRLTALPLYEDGTLILQDLASCFPAEVLNPPAEDGVECIDATSAPGNKTSHLSALMKGRGKIYAFERSPQRFKTLVSQLSRICGTPRDKAVYKATSKSKRKAEALDDASPAPGQPIGNVHPIQADFLSTDPEDERWSRVTHMLVDPSCSGSGIVGRLDYLLEGDQEQEDVDEGKERLQALAAFQLSMVRHAMRFPALERLVYSTCSHHAIEDEHVVLSALSSPEGAATGWRLARRDEGVIPSWPTRGEAEEMGGDETLAASLVRCEPGGRSGLGEEPHVEGTNGFFVACFVRDGARRRHGGDGGWAPASESKMEERKEEKSVNAAERKRLKKNKRKKVKTTTGGSAGATGATETKKTDDEALALLSSRSRSVVQMAAGEHVGRPKKREQQA